MVWSGVGAGLSGVVRCGSRVKWCGPSGKAPMHLGNTVGDSDNAKGSLAPKRGLLGSSGGREDSWDCS